MIRFEKLPTDIFLRLPKAQNLLEHEEGVVFAYLFGSQASGKTAALSDIDIAVFLRPESESGGYHFDLFDRLSEALGTAEVDLVILNRVPISLVGRIVLNRRILVDKEPAFRSNYESIKLRQFFDFRYRETMYFQLRYNCVG